MAAGYVSVPQCLRSGKATSNGEQQWFGRGRLCLVIENQWKDVQQQCVGHNFVECDHIRIIIFRYVPIILNHFDT